MLKLSNLKKVPGAELITIPKPLDNTMPEYNIIQWQALENAGAGSRTLSPSTGPSWTPVRDVLIKKILAVCIVTPAAGASPVRFLDTQLNIQSAAALGTLQPDAPGLVGSLADVFWLQSNWTFHPVGQPEWNFGQGMELRLLKKVAYGLGLQAFNYGFLAGDAVNWYVQIMYKEINT